MLVDHALVLEKRLEAFVRQHLQGVEHLVAGVAAKGQAETTAERLLSEDLGDRGPWGS